MTLKAISNLFTGAHHIKKWLITCAKLIGDFNCPVGWITPLGLPVVQPYRTLSKLDAISTVSQLLKVPSDNEMVFIMLIFFSYLSIKTNKSRLFLQIMFIVWILLICYILLNSVIKGN